MSLKYMKCNVLDLKKSNAACDKHIQ